MPTRSPAVDAYIRKSQPFARPILSRIRTIVHKQCPDVEECLKWGFPHFDYKGGLCSMAAFKQHCAFGFWKHTLLKDAEKVLEVKDRTAMGHLGRITKMAELPSTKALGTLVKQAVKLNEAGIKQPRVIKKKSPLKVPAYFMAAVRKNKKALATFEKFSTSCQREYVEWVSEAKQAATRERRMATTVEWLAQGKQRNWKYQ